MLDKNLHRIVALVICFAAACSKGPVSPTAAETIVKARRGWMNSQALHFQQNWRGRPYYWEHNGRPVPYDKEPWVFFGELLSCPTIPGEGWTAGDLPYLQLLERTLDHEFLPREKWSRVKPTGKTLRTYFPGPDHECGKYRIDWVEVEY